MRALSSTESMILSSLHHNVYTLSWMINFLHLSDFHIPDKRGDKRDNIDPFKKLDNLLDYARKLDLKPAYTIITGDLSDTGTPQSYKHVK